MKQYLCLLVLIFRPGGFWKGDAMAEFHTSQGDPSAAGWGLGAKIMDSTNSDWVKIWLQPTKYKIHILRLSETSENMDSQETKLGTAITNSEWVYQWAVDVQFMMLIWHNITMPCGPCCSRRYWRFVRAVKCSNASPFLVVKQLNQVKII